MHGGCAAGSMVCSSTAARTGDAMKVGVLTSPSAVLVRFLACSSHPSPQSPLHPALCASSRSTLLATDRIILRTFCSSFWRTCATPLSSQVPPPHFASPQMQMPSRFSACTIALTDACGCSRAPILPRTKSTAASNRTSPSPTGTETPGNRPSQKTDFPCCCSCHPDFVKSAAAVRARVLQRLRFVVF